MGSIQYKWAKKWTSGLKFNQLFVLLTWRTVRLLKIKLNPNKKFQRQKNVCFVIEQFKSVWLPSSIFDDNYFLAEHLKMEWSQKCFFLSPVKNKNLNLGRRRLNWFFHLSSICRSISFAQKWLMCLGLVFLSSKFKEFGQEIIKLDRTRLDSIVKVVLIAATVADEQ